MMTTTAEEDSLLPDCGEAVQCVEDDLPPPRFVVPPPPWLLLPDWGPQCSGDCATAVAPAASAADGHLGGEENGEAVMGVLGVAVACILFLVAALIVALLLSR
jgi:hypothetical protein